VAAVAFEDLYPNHGDADFNDFVTAFRIVEKVNSQDQITKIFIDFYPRAVGAGYDHEFLMVLDGVKDQPSNITLQTTPIFNGTASVTLTHFDPSSNVIDSQQNLPDNHDVVVFPSTHALFGSGNLTNLVDTTLSQPYQPANQSARIEIDLNQPNLNPVPTDGKIDVSKFRMILHVKDTDKDIDIIDVDPQNYDSSGYPFGFIIPTDWQWPSEGTSIDTVYPMFSQYRQYLLDTASGNATTPPSSVLDWFNEPASGTTDLYPVIPGPNLLPIP